MVRSRNLATPSEDGNQVTTREDNNRLRLCGSYSDVKSVYISETVTGTCSYEL
jgi:hypothetical protein